MPESSSFCPYAIVYTRTVGSATNKVMTRLMERLSVSAPNLLAGDQHILNL